ncbi:hypothetical protein H2248_011432 [Termitomyces sp. 'cryptogamus']|nr:hypothetical protein H2248_011432 [Termitomyces sp. 'cryptogamus']
MAAAHKASASRRQMKHDASRRLSPRSQTTSSTPAANTTLKLDMNEASLPSASTVPKTTGRQQQQPRRKHDESVRPTGDKQCSFPSAPRSATIKTALDTNAISATPTTESIIPRRFYAFGWDAHPTRASLNEICQHFLKGRCQHSENCHRIHPRAEKSCNSLTLTSTTSNSDRLVSTSKVSNSAQPALRARQGPSHVSESEKSRVHLRYQSERGNVADHSDVNVDSGQNSDGSEITIGFSPQGSSCSYTSKDNSAATNHSRTHPPPPSRYFCREWLQKACKRSYDCQYVHGDLEYDIPVNGIYPHPQNHTICLQWQKGFCTQGYLCRYRHGDLVYAQSTEQDKSTIAWDAEDTCSASDDSLSDEEDGEDELVTYPPPKSNAFCKKWMVNRCNLGPACFFFHGDVHYEPPVEGIHPPPPYPYVCKLSKLGECFLGYSCDFIHEELQYDTPPSRYPLPSHRLPTIRSKARSQPRFTEVCQQWILGRCKLGYACDYRHLNLKYDDPAPALLTPLTMPSTKPAPVDISINDPPIGQRPAPKNHDVCIQWLRGRCTARYTCRYRHEDLDYDPPAPKLATAPPLNGAVDANEAIEGQTWSVKVHDHARVKLGPGFEIQELQTGFETPWIYLGNISSRVTDKELADLLRPFGEVVDIKLPACYNSPTMLVRARFATPDSACDASAALHHTQAFGTTITARLPIHNASLRDGIFSDTSVRVRWEAPSRTAYCGYTTMELAKAAIGIASRKAFQDRFVHASIHVGLPVVGVVTVCFRGLPVNVQKEDMAWFAEPDDVVWAQPNYRNIDLAKNSIMRILQQDSELLDFTVQPPPYKNARVQAWAHFATAGDAKAACHRLHGRKPVFTGRTRVFAEHLQSLSFSISAAMYEKMGNDIRALSRTVYHHHRTTMSVVERPTPMSTLIKLSGDDLKELGQLKAELGKILNWETLRQGTVIAWDPFFAHPAGQSFLGSIEHTTPNVTIRVDIPRRMIRLLGPSTYRSTVRQQILDKLGELQTQQIHTILLDGWVLGQLMRTDLAQLQEQFGRDNINLDLYHRRLIVRGGDNVYRAARNVVYHARQAQLHPARRRIAAVCPVCFDEVTNPITLPCTHSWCWDCLTHYLSSSVHNRYFPLLCLGNNAKCTEHIPLRTARRVLTIPEFDAVVDAAFSAYIQARGEEFHYCPTPDCPQIYRRASKDIVLQCPSCLLRICPNCHVEAHDGFACPDPEGDNNLFREWMAHHDVKPCPGCNVLIERDEGCNHMTCTQCKTHICWVCLKTFPGGNGIYDHMHAAHGGIGLVN